MNPTRATVGFVHVGPDRHGVRRYGTLVERAVSATMDVQNIELPDGAHAAAHLARHRFDATVVHLQFSDHLLPIEDFEQVVGAVRRNGPGLRAQRIVVTLHDCPGIGNDTAAADARRAPAYQRAAGLADAVIVCSHHEREGLAATGVRVPVDVIAHLVEDRIPPERPSIDPGPKTVCVLGFVYPGKGHDRVVAACALVDEPLELVVLGEAAVGHEDLLDDLVTDAAAHNVRCRVTGWLDEPRLDDWLVDADVAVVAHHAPSASGSLATWLSAGRRPLVAASRYSCELDHLAPGSLRLFDPSDGAAALAGAIGDALRDPSSTRAARPHPVLEPATVAAAHVALYERVS